MTVETWDQTDPTKPTIPKDPDAILDYPIDLSAWLTPIADTIASVQTLVTNGVVVNEAIVNGMTVILWVAGGTPNTKATVTLRFTTNGGRTDDRTFYFKIKDR
jgi:hypothetical protein